MAFTNEMKKAKKKKRSMVGNEKTNRKEIKLSKESTRGPSCSSRAPAYEDSFTANKLNFYLI